MNADDMLDILTLKEAVKILRRNPPAHTSMMAHGAYKEHSHEVRPDHAGVPMQSPPETDPNANAIRWLTEVIGWIKKEGEKEA